jgi:hypothetical protein
VCATVPTASPPHVSVTATELEGVHETASPPACRRQNYFRSQPVYSPAPVTTTVVTSRPRGAASASARRRVIVSAVRVDRYLTARLRQSAAFGTVRLSAGYRLRTPDASGCNWSGDVVAIHGPGGPTHETLAAALRPIIEAARARFNLSE